MVGIGFWKKENHGQPAQGYWRGKPKVQMLVVSCADDQIRFWIGFGMIL
jgi:hypothetical protein